MKPNLAQRVESVMSKSSRNVAEATGVHYKGTTKPTRDGRYHNAYVHYHYVESEALKV
jgi:hypothetical protein